MENNKSKFTFVNFLMALIAFLALMFLFEACFAPGGLFDRDSGISVRSIQDFETKLYDDGEMKIAPYNGYRILENVSVVKEDEPLEMINITVTLIREPET